MEAFLQALLVVLAGALLVFIIWFWLRLRRIARSLTKLAAALDEIFSGLRRYPWLR